VGAAGVLGFAGLAFGLPFEAGLSGGLSMGVVDVGVASFVASANDVPPLLGAVAELGARLDVGVRVW
jgi:hypothetical protein